MLLLQSIFLFLKKYSFILLPFNDNYHRKTRYLYFSNFKNFDSFFHSNEYNKENFIYLGKYFYDNNIKNGSSIILKYWQKIFFSSNIINTNDLTPSIAFCYYNLLKNSIKEEHYHNTLNPFNRFFKNFPKYISNINLNIPNWLENYQSFFTIEKNTPFSMNYF